MWNELCDDQHDAEAMRYINRLVLGIVVCFLSFGVFAMSTRLGNGAPPESVAYGTQAAAKDQVVFGD